MSKADRLQIYEIRDGDSVLDRFEHKAPAERRKKELKRAGRKVRLFSLFVRKFIPLEKKELPKGMEFWKGSYPWEIPPEAASQLRIGWEHIREVFYIGAYRHGEMCLPNDRTEDLSLQPDGDGLALCYHIIPERKTYLILGRVDHINVTPLNVEFFGTLEDGSLMMVSMEISGSRMRKEPREIPFRKGWYQLANGALLFVDERDEKRTEEEQSEELAGMFPYLTVYPGFMPGDYAVGRGYLPIKDGESLEQAVGRTMRTSPQEYIETDNMREVASAFRRKDAGMIRRLAETHRINGRFAAVVSANRRRRLIGWKGRK